MNYDVKRDDKNKRRIYQDLCGIEFVSYRKRSKDNSYSPHDEFVTASNDIKKFCNEKERERQRERNDC